MLKLFFRQLKPVFFFLAGLFLLTMPGALGQSPDAIAIRVVANPGHFSALRWYNENVAFRGSPQLLTVDGYPAVRDGRTVYVDAANVDLTMPSLYTNIYIISYNQQAEKSTVDIFGQILANWRFNANLNTSGSCNDKPALSCLADAECAGNGFCTSFKAQVTRDTIRMARLKDIDLIIEKYRQANKHYPILSAGTYLPNKTISVWPSWQGTLGKELGASLPLDPVNKLDACAGYDKTTCWDEANKTFAWATELNAGTIPPNNFIFLYKSNLSGSSHTLCALSETGMITGACNTSCVPLCFGRECGPDACGGSCAPGCAPSETCSGGSCQTACSSAPGCRASLANATVVSGFCASGSCYSCNFGYSWDGSNCVAVTSCSPDGCNGNCPTLCTAAADPDCGSGGCCGDGTCDTGETTATCPGDCPLNCTATPGCRTTAPANASVVAGTCSSGQNCYGCDAGYTWDGSSCSLAVPPCSTPPGCQSSLANASVVSGYCSSGSCYACNGGYFWNSGTGQCEASGPACSTPPGCQTSLANATVVAGACASGSCYACNGGYVWDGSACSVPPPVCTDNDSDGYGNPGSLSCAQPQTDCNDSNPAIYPGAAEICDGVDNNCDGVVDEGCDVDNDNYCSCSATYVYGSDLTAVCSGTNSTNAVSIASTCDCNDSNDATYPGAAEICGDNIDQDCSGADLACSLPCTDLDSDGYGNPGSPTCAQPQTDCNDGNPAIYPGAPEICGNGIDEDCSGADLVCPIPVCTFPATLPCVFP